MAALAPSSLSAIHASPTASAHPSRNCGSRSRLSPLPTRITIRQRADTKSASPMSVFASTPQSPCRGQNWPMNSFDLDELAAGRQPPGSPATDLAEAVRRHEHAMRRSSAFDLSPVGSVRRDRTRRAGRDRLETLYLFGSRLDRSCALELATQASGKTGARHRGCRRDAGTVQGGRNR